MNYFAYSDKDMPLPWLDRDRMGIIYRWLDEVRETGKINMFGASPYLVEQFGLTKTQAKEVLVDWMESFESRHAAGGKQ